MKPRLLFPTPEQLKAKEMSQAMEDDEEAVTDVDESNRLATPKDQVARLVATPKAPRFGPVSPPTTARSTRSKQLRTHGSPAEIEDDGNLTPGHEQSGTADEPSTGGGRKRGGESLKRARRGKKARGE